MNKSTATILDLPNEIISRILNELHLIELIKLRIVSKRFKYLIDTLEKKELTVFKNCYRPNIYYYFYYKQKIDFKVTIFVSLKKLRPLFNNFFYGLKKLNILFNSSKLDLKILDDLIYLESLHIDDFISYENQLINAPKLKNLTIVNKNYDHEVFSKENIVTIRSKIEKLNLTIRVNEFEIEFPEKIKYLNVFKKYNPRIKFFNLTKFKNLITLRLENYALKSNVLLEKLTHLKNLENLYFDNEHSNFLDEKANYKFMCNFMKKIKLKKISAKKIYYRGIELIEEFKNYNFKLYINEKNEKLHLKNYKYLSDNNDQVNIIELDDLIDLIEKDNNLFDDEEKDNQISILPKNFFNKYNNIIGVSGNMDRIGPNEFIYFLKKCNCINYLTIKSKLNQNFLDQLPSICDQTLYILYIDDLKNEEINKLNYDPISKLNYLNFLNFDSEFDPEIAIKLINDSKSLTKLEFCFSKRRIRIEKCSKKFNEKFVKELNRPYLSLADKFSDKPGKIFDAFAICLTSKDHVKDFDEKYPNKKVFHYYYDEYDQSNLELINENYSKFDDLFIVRCFNRNISKVGLNINQLNEYIKTIPDLLDIELKNGTKSGFGNFRYPSFLPYLYEL